MISCPSCDKGYRVAASAIPPGGREVRCSACGEAWFERGEMAEVIAAAAGEADLAPSYYGADDGQVRTRRAAGGGRPVIETTYEAPARARAPTQDASEPHAATPTDEAASSPAREQQRALALAYAPTGDVADEAEPPRARDALAALLAALHGKLGSLGRSRPAAPTGSAGDAAARTTRARLRARAANKVTPGRVLGWTLWIGAVASVSYALTAEREAITAAYPPLAKVYALGAPPVRAEGLSVDAEVARYAASIEGPVVLLRGTVRNTGAAASVPLVTLTASAPDGLESQIIPLPDVALPPGGERPFAVRALLPLGATTLSLGVESDLSAPEAGEGFAMQRQGAPWPAGDGRAGPPPRAR